MNCLLLGINYGPEVIGISVYSEGMARDMAARGNEVSVVTAVPYYPAWKIFDGWRNLWQRREEHGVRVTRCPLYVPARPSGARRIVHHASFALAALPVMLWIALTRRPDVVIVVAPSLIAAPVGLIAAKLVGAKTWLHIQDFEVEAAFATGLIAKESRVGRLARAFERRVLARFDRISSISRPMLDKLGEKGVPPERLHELRNWANLAAVTPFEGPSPMKAELGLTPARVALYSGNLANKQGLDILPEVARRLAHRRDLTFAICGEGPMRERLETEARGMENVRFYPLQPLDKLSGLLGAADMHLLPQIAGAAELVLPSKLTNMLASGRPVVATAEPGTALAAEVEGCGIITPPGDADAMARAIETLLDDPGAATRMGIEARQRALDRWDGRVILGRFHDALEQVVARKSPVHPFSKTNDG